MDKVTLQWIIRRYADLVLKGLSDTDLTPRARRYLGIALNVASNSTTAATSTYPPTEGERDVVVRVFLDSVENVMPFLTSGEATDFGAASERAITVIRGV